MSYFPIHDPKGALSRVVLVATDKTDEESQARALHAERVRGARVLRILKSKDEFLAFNRMVFTKLAEFRAAVGDTRPEPSAATVASFVRFLHTLKGGCAMFALDSIAELAHRAESDWKSAGGVQGPRERIASQLEALRAALQDFRQENEELIAVLGSGDDETREVPRSLLYRYEGFLRSTVGERSEALREFQRAFIRKPARQIFAPFERETLRLADSLGKAISPFVIEGGDILLDPQRMAELVASLTHVFRNIVDHGIEDPGERRSRGKAPEGHIQIEVSPFFKGSESWLRLEIEDDGRGIDPARIAAVLRKKGMEHLLAGKSDSEILQLIFEPGFSTADQVTTLSGRGIGMDAVAHAARSLGGRISVHSVVDQGTQLLIEVAE